MFAAESVPYKNTHSFGQIVLNYVAGDDLLSSFYSFPPNIAGVEQAIQQRKNQPINRNILVDVLQDQYKNIAAPEVVLHNIEALRSGNTFSVCTAHQPNILTGPLYFIYKILHAIKLAKTLSERFPGSAFVPVYYMGSEDADLEELNHTYVEGKKYEWKTNQKGAVGRMVVDASLINLLSELKSQIGITKNGQEFITLLEKCYQKGGTIQEATLKLVNALFGRFGLIVLIADDARLKALMLPVFEDDLFRSASSDIVEKTSTELGKKYNVQAQPRSINLFYLKDSIRERIEEKDKNFYVVNTDLCFSPEELRAELHKHPERFSPNVILRGLFQETILPNVAFIGGGGELAYWLQLKGLFIHYKVAFPVLVLRNSFLIIDKRENDLQQKLRLTTGQLFLPEFDILNTIIKEKGAWPELKNELQKTSVLYDGVKQSAAAVDVTLLKHVEALKAKAAKDLKEVERKMQRAERRKNEDLKNQLATLKKELFPGGGLQERVENVSQFYAKWGAGFIDEIYNHSLSLEQQFMVLRKNS